MAPTFIVNAVSLVFVLLQVAGIQVAQADLQTTVTTLVVICTGLFTLYRQVTTGRSTLSGTRPK